MQTKKELEQEIAMAGYSAEYADFKRAELAYRKSLCGSFETMSKRFFELVKARAAYQSSVKNPV